MLNSFRKPALVPAVRRWDSMFDSVMSKLDLLPGEDLHSDLDDYIHPDIEISESTVVVRMAGLESEEGALLLTQSISPFLIMNKMADAVSEIVKQVKGGV